jgi:putative ABC transport system permease protein
MSIPGVSRGAFTIWRVLLLAQLRESPARLAVTVLAIALGVALGAAVYLVNSAALNEFGLATKRLVGEADVVVRGPREGFSEQLFTRLARDPAVSAASPVLELDVALPGRRESLKVLGVDPFRAATMQPALMGDIGGGLFALFQPDSIYLSSSSAQDLKLRRGDLLQVTVGSSPKALRVQGILSEGTYSQELGLMDIASVDFQSNRPVESDRFAPEPGQRCRRLSPRSWAAVAGRRCRRRPASGARPRN